MFDALHVICTAINDILPTRIILSKFLICAQNPEVCKMDNIFFFFFFFENRPKSVLKDMAGYPLTFHCICYRFETVFITIFKIND